VKISIKQEYLLKVKPVPDKEYQKLKNDIAQKGLTYPIIVNKEGIVLDGHHRFRVCQELNIKPTIIVKEFKDDLDEEEFVIISNLLRRHLEPFEKAEYGYILEEIESKRASRRQKELGKSHGVPLETDPLASYVTKGKTSEIISKKVDLETRTYERAKVVIAKASEQTKDMLREGKTTISTVYNEIKKQEAVTTLLAEPTKIKLPKNIKLLKGDFVQECKQIDDNSIDLIFTDPPYDKKSLHLYEELGFTAHRLLKEGGSLITFVGTYDIPKILELVQKNGLKYWWVICVKHTGAHAHMMQKRVFVYWKPMLWFVKGKDIMEGLESLPDFVESKPPDKTLHKWEQSTVEAEHVINKLTIGENQIVLDPFMGSGTTGIATLHLKRKFIGIEKDPEKFEIAKRRLENESMQTL